MVIVIPTNDTEEHEEESTLCKCEPSVQYENGEMIIVHNAFDNREIIETIEKILMEKEK